MRGGGERVLGPWLEQHEDLPRQTEGVPHVVPTFPVAIVWAQGSHQVRIPSYRVLYFEFESLIV